MIENHRLQLNSREKAGWKPRREFKTFFKIFFTCSVFNCITFVTILFLFYVLLFLAARDMGS